MLPNNTTFLSVHTVRVNTLLNNLQVKRYKRRSITWSVGMSEKSSGGLVMTYRFDDASQDELRSLNL